MWTFFKKSALLLAISLIVACVKAPEEVVDNLPNVVAEETVFIINEGNFQWGNASISSYNLKTGQVYQNVFQTANNRPLGDVAQSAYLFNDKLYIVVNNSGKIEIVNPKTFIATSTFTGFVSPRYFLPINNSKAYVSDLYANRIYVINPNNGIIIKEIPIQAWTEQMIMVENMVWVSSPTKKFIYQINTQTDELVDSVSVQIGCYNLLKDGNYIFALSSGSSQNNQNSVLLIFNTSNLGETKTIIFPTNRRASQLCIDKKNKYIIWSEGSDLYKMNYDDTSLPSTPFIQIPNSNIYGIDILSSMGHIYIADARDYVSLGKVYIYDMEGNQINVIPTGVIPSRFVFY